MRLGLGRVAVVALAVCLAGCGGGGDHRSAPQSSDAQVWTAAAPTTTTTPISHARLEKTLLPVTRLPPGYTKERTRTARIDCSRSGTSKPPRAKEVAYQTYSHAIGQDRETVILSIHQYASAHDARRTFDSITQTSCPPQQVKGQTVTPIRMRAPHIGEASTGLRILAGGTDIGIYDVLDGVSIVEAQIVDTDTLDVELLRKVTRRQVRAYTNAAS